MCGIAGAVSLQEHLAPPPVEMLQRMAGALHHRGPDEFGVYRDARAGLAHARLSIIDLSSGQQPLSDQHQALWIVFNGEIFNYLELREQLVAMGHPFRTRSDTEVIVQAYRAWGDAAFERFNGQWAVALWDAQAQKLVLARDRVGVRPLYYGEHRGRLYFASEVKALFAADPELPRALDPTGLAETFTFWSVVPPQSVFAGIRELEPGHLRTYHRGQVTDRAIWTQRFPASPEEGFRGTLAEATEAVSAALARATALRMLRSDVPVGSYLSGGLDSSLVATLGRRAKEGQFCTFSLRFEDPEYDETTYQRLMAKQLGSAHQEVVVTRSDIGRVFPEVVFHTERPILRTAPAPLFLLSKLVRDAGIKVVLTGEGADEMFAGYDLFREGKVRRFWARQPQSKARPLLLDRLYPYLARSPVAQRAISQRFFQQELDQFREPGFAHQTRWRTTSALQRLFSSELRATIAQAQVVPRLLGSLPPEFSRWKPLAQDQYLEVRTLLSGYLLSSQGDRMLMAHSVEGRFPFLDSEVMALAQSLPPEFKLRGLDEKHVLKRACRAQLPAEVVSRTKQPYRAPDGACFVGDDAPEWVADVVSEGALKETGVFEPRAVGQLFAKCRAAAARAPLSNADNMAVVGVVSTQLLHRQFVRSEQRPRPVPLKTLHDFLNPGS